MIISLHGHSASVQAVHTDIYMGFHRVYRDQSLPGRPRRLFAAIVFLFLLRRSDPLPRRRRSLSDCSARLDIECPEFLSRRFCVSAEPLQRDRGAHTHPRRRPERIPTRRDASIRVLSVYIGNIKRR